jgi:hypothetical protein
MTCSSTVPIANVLYPISFLLKIPDTAVLSNQIDQALPHSDSCEVGSLVCGAKFSMPKAKCGMQQICSVKQSLVMCASGVKVGGAVQNLSTNLALCHKPEVGVGWRQDGTIGYKDAFCC